MSSRVRRSLSLLAFALVAMPGAAIAQEPAAYFKRSCSSCHTVGGGPLAGPDLKDVAKRAERAWLVEFLQNPQAMIDKGDPYAAKLLREARNVVMPRVEGMSRERATALLDLIDAESKLERSQFKGAEVSDRPLTAADVEQGRALFTGRASLKNGGPACMGCHTIGGIGPLGGGRLGPDLTDAFARLEGRRALSAWLSAPATPAMGKVFGPHPLEPDEVLGLVAALKDANEKRDLSSQADGLNFLVLGIAAVGASLVLIDSAWKRRFRAVREPLVMGEARDR